ncbi:hypothetical protein BDQ12DRAFT_691078 [Crucibulum laeve]|uniref:DUF6533 domain-containing protein n=1 Tax=Crucibulum laeve TaxID=68775 RepID=A0A5C3LXA7_9AGAR|nr:hypothetical protein BDQ12DRAFT_691078 [Crucibulum laeve]
MHPPSENILTLFQHTQIFRYLNVASIGILIYDWSLTFDLEVSLVWTARWNFIKVLFLMTRYLPFLDSIVIFYHQFKHIQNTDVCQVAYKINGWLFITGGCLGELMLSLRTLAVWQRDKYLAVGLSIFFVAVWGAAAVVLSIFLRSMTFTILTYPFFTGCLNDGGNSILYVVWILLMVYDTVNLTLMTISAVKNRQPCSTTALTTTVYRDGIVYYLYLFVLSLLNVVLILKLPPDYVNLLSMFKRTMHSVFSCRAILHIREQGEASTNYSLPLIHVSPTDEI